MIVKRTKDPKKIAMAEELRGCIAERLRVETREKELKKYFSKILGKQDAVLVAGNRQVVSTYCERSILDAQALSDKLGDLDPYKKDSSYTEISVRNTSDFNGGQLRGSAAVERSGAVAASASVAASRKPAKKRAA